MDHYTEKDLFVKRFHLNMLIFFRGVKQKNVGALIPLTFSPHSNFDAFIQPTILTLVTMMLVNRAVAISSACIRQVPPHASLEKTFAPLTSILPIMFPT